MSERLFGTVSARLLRAVAVGDDREGQPYLVTDLLVGRDVQRLGQVRWEVACEITRQAAAAVAEMHLQGLHHGSLRASTFFVAASSAGGSRVKLLDLGIGDRTATAAKDVRALTAILHRLLTGRPPLPAKARPQPFRLGLNGLPPALEQALGRWLDAEGEDTPAADMATELKAIGDASHGEFWSGAPVTRETHVLPRTSMIMLGDEDDDDDDAAR